MGSNRKEYSSIVNHVNSWSKVHDSIRVVVFNLRHRVTVVLHLSSTCIPLLLPTAIRGDLLLFRIYKLCQWKAEGLAFNVVGTVPY
jgi:hypothetical protein